MLLKNTLIKVSTSCGIYLKMAGSYHGSISKNEHEFTNDMFFLNYSGVDEKNFVSKSSRY